MNSFKELIAQSLRRTREATLGVLGVTDPGLRAHLAEQMPDQLGADGCFLASPVFEHTFGWKEAPETLGDLEGDLLSTALLDALHKTKPAVDTLHKVSGPAYTVNENVEYQFMVVIDNGKGDLNNFKIGISDYNSEMFASSGLTINSMMLDNLHTLVLVKSFGSRKADLAKHPS